MRPAAPRMSSPPIILNWPPDIPPPSRRFPVALKHMQTPPCSMPKTEVPLSENMPGALGLQPLRSPML